MAAGMIGVNAPSTLGAISLSSLTFRSGAVVIGQPTWQSAQTFPGLTLTADLSIGANKLKTTNGRTDSGSTKDWIWTTDVATTSAGLIARPSYPSVLNGNPRGFVDIENSNDTTNYERLRALASGSSGFLIDVEKGGTGSLRTLKFQMSGNDIITLNTDNTMNFNSRAISNHKVGSATPFVGTDQTGVAVSAAGIHAALVNLGLITS